MEDACFTNWRGYSWCSGGEIFCDARDRFGAVEGTRFVSGGGMSLAIRGVGLLICTCMLSQLYDHAHDRQSARRLA